MGRTTWVINRTKTAVSLAVTTDFRFRTTVMSTTSAKATTVSMT